MVSPPLWITSQTAAFAGLPSFNLRQEIHKMDAQHEKLEAQARSWRRCFVKRAYRR